MPVDLDWGNGWSPLANSSGSGLQAELERELHAKHPLHDALPAVFGRCRVCDDVVAFATKDGQSTDFVVIHLTWSGRSEKPKDDGIAWPYFERVTQEEFVTRFLRGGEHL